MNAKTLKHPGHIAYGNRNADINEAFQLLQCLDQHRCTHENRAQEILASGEPVNAYLQRCDYNRALDVLVTVTARDAAEAHEREAADYASQMDAILVAIGRVVRDLRRQLKAARA